jgi:riboflavin synthase
MFTGIIEAVGSVRALTQKRGYTRVEIAAGPVLQACRIGDSIAVDGACLTVTRIVGETFAADLSAETLARTTLGDLRVGAPVNLERPLRLGDRLGGHLVTGHVDGTGQILARIPQGGDALFRIRFPQQLAPLLVPKGSVAVDGISLTVAELHGDVFGVALIPHTLEHTTWGNKRAGARVNIEADLVGKHVTRFAAKGGRVHADGPLTLAVLKEHGFA